MNHTTTRDLTVQRQKIQGRGDGNYCGTLGYWTTTYYSPCKNMEESFQLNHTQPNL
jgi:hypothetical protein